jgi:hypothetical protein
MNASRSLLAVIVVLATALPARAGQTVHDVLSFLLTNRSIPTGDFVRDQAAAAATSATVAELLLSELSTVPITSSASGFTYRFDPALGVAVRASDSFGPVFVERSLTAGRGRASIAVTFHATSYGEIDGRSLTDGTLVSTASWLKGQPAPFDVETVTLRIETRTSLVSANVGLTDRLDIGAVVSLLHVSLDGSRLDTYRGTEYLQATGAANASGLGDVIARGKFNVFQAGGSGVAVAAEARFPTGDADNLLGSGRTIVTPRVIGSLERGRAGLHGDVGYAVGGFSDEWHYRGALTVAAHSRLTVVGELLGRRLAAADRLTETIDPHPSLVNVETVRLTSDTRPANRITILGGVRWNAGAAWLLTATLLRPITRDGLRSAWVPAVTLDYSFGR